MNVCMSVYLLRSSLILFVPCFGLGGIHSHTSEQEKCPILTTRFNQALNLVYTDVIIGDFHLLTDVIKLLRDIKGSRSFTLKCNFILCMASFFVHVHKK